MVQVSDILEKLKEHDEGVDEKINAVLRMVLEKQADAYAQAIKKILTDPDSVDAILDAFGNRAAQRAQRLAGAGIFSVVKIVFLRWIASAFLIIYIAKTFGVEYATKLWRIFTGG